MTREIALKQSIEIQEAVIAQLQRFGKLSSYWVLRGGSTEDDGENLRVTIALEIRYASWNEAAETTIA